MKKLYEGKAKTLFATDNPEEVLVVYSNQATALNGKKKAQIEGKGKLNNQISSQIYTWLNQHSIETQFIKQVDETSQLVKKLAMLPVEVVVRNVVAGSLAKRFDLPEGNALAHPSVEFFYKDDNLGDPFINASQLSALGLVSEADSALMSKKALEINNALIGLFDAIDLTLVDIKFEFGRDAQGNIILGDEISPDNCRLWDKNTHQKMDKDNFRQELGDIIPIYQAVSDRLKAYLNK